MGRSGFALVMGVRAHNLLRLPPPPPKKKKKKIWIRPWHITIFAKLSETWLSRGSYGVYVALTGPPCTGTRSMVADPKGAQRPPLKLDQLLFRARNVRAHITFCAPPPPPNENPGPPLMSRRLASYTGQLYVKVWPWLQLLSVRKN